MASRLFTGAVGAAAALVFTGAYPDVSGAQADKPRFELTVQPRVGGINDIFTVTVRIETQDLAGPTSYTAPRFSGFSVTIPTQSRPRIIRGHGAGARFVEIKRYSLQPKRTGTLYISPARMQYRGRTVETRSGSVEVKGRSSKLPRVADPTAAGRIGAPGYVPPLPPEEDDMFLHAVVDKKTAYVGEQVIVTWLVFTRGDIGHLDPRKPRLHAWWSETLYDPKRNFVFHDVNIGETDYRVAIVSKLALFATKSGTLRIPILRATASRRYRRLVRRELIGPQLEVRIKPLPGGAPAGFDPSYVGTFELEASIDAKKIVPGQRMEIGAGQPIILKLKITGKGAVPRTTAPVLKMAVFRFGAPRDQSARMTTTGDVAQGERIYRYWTTSQGSGPQEIASIRVPYFNPATGRYHVAESKPIALLIIASKGGGVGLTSRTDRLARELRAIRTGSTINSRTVSYFHDSRWFWLLVLLPPLGFIGVVAYQRVRRVLEEDTPKSRRRRARGRARKRFRTAASHLKAGNDRELATELARLIYEALESSLQQPVRSMTRPQLRDFLVEHGFDIVLIANVDAEIERCDFARFAPSSTDGAELSEMLERVQELVGSIRDAGHAATEESDAA